MSVGSRIVSQTVCPRCVIYEQLTLILYSEDL